VRGDSTYTLGRAEIVVPRSVYAVATSAMRPGNFHAVRHWVENEPPLNFNKRRDIPIATASQNRLDVVAVLSL
jgi:hypothetical protein